MKLSNICILFLTINLSALYSQVKNINCIIKSTNFDTIVYYNSQIDYIISSDYLELPKFTPIQKLSIRNKNYTVQNLKFYFNNSKKWFSADDIYSEVFDTNFKKIYFNVWRLAQENVRHYYGTYNAYLYEHDDIVKLLTIYGYGLCHNFSYSSSQIFKLFSQAKEVAIWGAPGHVISDIFVKLVPNRYRMENKINNEVSYLFDADQKTFYTLRDNKTLANKTNVSNDRWLYYNQRNYGKTADYSFELRYRNTSLFSPLWSLRYGSMDYDFYQNYTRAPYKINIILRKNESINFDYGTGIYFNYDPEYFIPFDDGFIKNGWFELNLSGNSDFFGYLFSYNNIFSVDSSIRKIDVSQVASFVFKFSYPFPIKNLKIISNNKCPIKVYLKQGSSDWNHVGTLIDSLDSFNQYWKNLKYPTYEYYCKLEVSEYDTLDLKKIDFLNYFQVSPFFLPNFKKGENLISVSCESTDSVNLQLEILYKERNDNSPPSNDIYPVFPANGSVYDGAGLIIQWTNATDPDGDAIVDYDFELSDDSTFSIPYSPNFMRYTSTFKSGRLNEFPVENIAWLNHNETYYWRVRAKDANGFWGDWSNVFSFKVLNIKWPINLGYQIFDDSIKIFWSPHPEGKRPAYYEVHHSNEKLGFIPFETTVLKTTTDTFVVLPKEGIKAFYRVIAVSNNGQKSYPSEALRIQYPIFSNIKFDERNLYKINLNVPKVYQRLYSPTSYSDGNILKEMINYQFLKLPYFVSYNPSDTSLNLNINSITRGKIAYDTSLASVILWSEAYNPHLSPQGKQIAIWNNDYYAYTHRIKLITDHQNSLPELSKNYAVLFDTLNSFSFQVIDIDTIYGDSVKILSVIKPTWCELNQNGYTFNVYANIGYNFNDFSDSIVFILKDKLSDTLRLRINLDVKHLNRLPVLVSFPTLDIDEDKYFSWHVKYFDLDEFYENDSVNFAVIQKPGWLNFNADSLKFYGIPRIYDLNDTVLTVKLFDKYGGERIYNFAFKIRHINHAPQFINIPKLHAYEDSLYYSRVVAVDIDTLVGDRLKYISESMPSWLALNDTTGELYGTPEGKDVGVHLIKIKVVDSEGAYDRLSFVLTVIHVNHAPYFEYVNYPDSLTVDGEYEIEYLAKDKDSELFGDEVEVELTRRPRYAEHISEERKIILRPKTIDYAAGDTVIILRAKDNHGLSCEKIIILKLLHKNHPPKIAGIDADTVYCYEDDNFEMGISYYDEDEIVGDSVRIIMRTDATWLEYDDIGMKIKGTPRITDLGAYLVKLEAEDKQGAKDSLKFYVKTIHVNHPPKILGLTNLIAKQDSLFEAYVLYRDIDYDYGLDSLIFDLYSVHNWLKIDEKTGRIYGNPTFDDVGIARATIKIIDSHAAADEIEVAVEVKRKFRTFKFDYPNDRTFVDSLFKFKISFEDSVFYMNESIKSYYSSKLRFFRTNNYAPNDEFEIIMLQKPSWLNLDKDELLFYGTPSGNDAGINELKFAIDFKDGNIFEIKLLIEVIYINKSPNYIGERFFILKENQKYQTKLLAFDPDTLQNDKIMFVLKDTTYKNWIKLDPYNGEITFSPKKENAGFNIVKFYLIDDKTNLKEDSIFAAVLEERRIIRHNLPDTIVILEEQDFEYKIEIKDSIYYVFNDTTIALLENWISHSPTMEKYIDIERIFRNRSIIDWRNYSDVDHVSKINLKISQPIKFITFDDKQLILKAKPTKTDCGIYRLSLIYEVNDFAYEITLFVKAIRLNYPPQPTRFITESKIDTIKLQENKIAEEKLNFVWNKAKDKNSLDTLTYIIYIKNEQNLFSFKTQDTAFAMPMSLIKKNSDIEIELYVSDNTEKIFCDKLNIYMLAISQTEKRNIPKDYFISGNYPNPFNNQTRIKFGLPEPSKVRATVYNSIGQRLFDVFEEIMPEGIYERIINFDNDINLSSGVYYIEYYAYSLSKNYKKFIKLMYIK